MVGFVWLLACLAIGYVMFWLVRNERQGLGGHAGLIGMKRPRGEARPGAQQGDPPAGPDGRPRGEMPS